MKLDRNAPDGRGKYAVVYLRDLNGAGSDPRQALETLREGGFVTMGKTGARDEFFVVMLKDKNAHAALMAYAAEAEADDPEYAAEVRQMAHRAGPYHPDCKRPD